MGAPQKKKEELEHKEYRGIIYEKKFGSIVRSLDRE